MGSVNSILKNSFNQYKVTFLQEFSEDDFDHKLEFCKTIMRKVDDYFGALLAKLYHNFLFKKLSKPLVNETKYALLIQICCIASKILPK